MESTAPAPAKWDATALVTLLQAQAAEVTPRPFKAPDLPFRLPEGHRGLALDSQPMQNIYSYLNRGILCGLGFPGYQYLAELSQRAEYRAPAETLSTEMTRRGFELVGDKEGDHATRIKELTRDIKDYGINEHLKRIVEHDTYFGRASLAINIKGQEKRTRQPLIIAPETVRKGSLLGFRTVEPIWSTPLTWNSLDATAPDFYKPTSWYVLSQEWHSTRFLQFVSRELPDMLKPSYNFSGMSMSQLIEPYVNRWLKTVDSVNRLISNFSKLVLKTNMQDALSDSPGGAASLLQRLTAYVNMADSRGVLAMDMTQEDLELLNTPLSGLHELQAQAQEHMAAPTHIPLVKMFGITPTGLNASSEGEIKVYYDWVGASQVSTLGQHLPKIIDLLQLNRYGDIDPGIAIQWIPLDTPTDHELSQIRKSDADAGAIYIAGGVISPEEERARLQNDPTSGYDNLTGPAPELPTEEDEHARGEESADNAHERNEEAAENQHTRDKELKKIDVAAKKKPA